MFNLIKAGLETGPCLTETVQKGSREIFLVLFQSDKQEQDHLEMYLFNSLKVQFIEREIPIKKNIDLIG